jgi:hypothetical protein
MEKDMMLELGVSQHTYQENESGPTFDMKVGYYDNPVGEDSDTEVYLIRVRSSEGDEFTLKFRFTLSALATGKLGLGHVKKEVDRRRTIAISKACDMIKEGNRKDLIVTMGSDGIWEIEEPKHPLLKYTERKSK